MKLKIFVLTTVAFIFHGSAHACGPADFSRPEVMARLNPLLGLTKAALEISEPLASEQVSVVDSGEIVIEQGDSGQYGISIDHIRLSNGVEAKLGYYPTDSLNPPLFWIEATRVGAVYDSYGRMVDPGKCFVEIASYADETITVVNRTTNYPITSITYDTADFESFYAYFELSNLP